jgi:hypothetical protein
VLSLLLLLTVDACGVCCSPPSRNHIPEKKGTWMEEWHQKLHNNTTPDDVPICSAYIAFLEVRKWGPKGGGGKWGAGGGLCER